MRAGGAKAALLVFKNNELKKGKEMKILDAAKITDIARIISLTVMLAYMVLLFIRFINSYLSACVLYFTVHRQAVFNRPYARKRVVNRVAHDRKFALFQRYGEQEAYLGYDI